MKKLLILTVCCSMLLPAIGYAQKDKITLYFFQGNIEYHLQYDPFFWEDQIWLAARDLAPLTWDELTWDEASKTAVLSRPNRTISFTLGQKDILVEENQEKKIVSMKVPPFAIAGRMYLPVRFTMDISGGSVVWNGEARSLIIDPSMYIIPRGLSAEQEEEQKKTMEKYKDETPEDRRKRLEKDKNAYEEDQRQKLEEENRIASEEQQRKLEERQKKMDVKTSFDITKTVHYSYKDENLDEIIDYIKENIDRDFDINYFQVTTNMDSVLEHKKSPSITITLELKRGDFVTKNGYSINVTNGLMDTIIERGTPACNQDNMNQMFRNMSETGLKKDVLKMIELSPSEEIVSQKVLKKYGTEPYYTVVTTIHNPESNIERTVSRDYR